MAKKTVKALVEGGKASAAPPLGPALGQLKVNIGKVIEEINKKTKDFAGMQVPVEITVDMDTKEFEISVGTPPTSSLIKKELGAKKLGPDQNLNITFEQIKKIASAKSQDLLGDMKAKVKQVLGTCVSVGVKVDGKDPKEVQKDIDEGKIEIE